ncbi:hypothetical protein [Caballeronia sp. KNU42]
MESPDCVLEPEVMVDRGTPAASFANHTLHDGLLWKSTLPAEPAQLRRQPIPLPAAPTKINPIDITIDLLSIWPIFDMPVFSNTARSGQIPRSRCTR